MKLASGLNSTIIPILCRFMGLTQLYFENPDLDFTEQFVHAKSSLGVSCECLLIVGHPGGSLVNISGRVERGSWIMVSWWNFYFLFRC